jgi:hypothetical protein
MPNHHNAQSDNSSELAALETRLVAATEMWRDAAHKHDEARAIAHNKHLEMIAEKDRGKKKILNDEWNILYAKEVAALTLATRLRGIMTSVEDEIEALKSKMADEKDSDDQKSQNSVKPGIREFAAGRQPVQEMPRAATGQKSEPLDRSLFNLPAVKQKPGAMLGLPVRGERSIPPEKPLLPTLPPQGDNVWPGIGPEIGAPIITSPGFPTPEDGVVPPEVGLPSIDLPDPGMPEVFYPSQPAKKPTPEQLGFRRARRDGQPLSKVEIFYPDDSRANEYTYVRKETEPREKTLAEILYDNPTSWPKK